MYNLPIAEHGTYVGNLSPSVLAPRMSGPLLLSTSDDCNAMNVVGQPRIGKIIVKNTYTNVSNELPNSSDEIAINGFSVDIACGLEFSQLGWRRIV
jgi:hypothetical protein